MKEMYQMNAFHYIIAIYDYINNWYNWDDIIEATEKVFWHTGKSASVECGSARMVIVGEDFVIKWDYDECIKNIGGCEDEFNVYKKSLSTRYSHLLAPIYRVNFRERNFYIMPRVHNIGKQAHNNKGLDAFTTRNEYDWLIKNIGDLHSWNWGVENGKAVIIDYACRGSGF